MGKLTRPLVVTFISFYFVAQYFPGINYGDKKENLIILGLVFALLALVVKPIIKVLLLPFNLLTLGGVSALLNIALVFVLSFIFPFFIISSFNFAGYNLVGFPIPAFTSNPITTASLFSIVLSLLSSLIYYLII